MNWNDLVTPDEEWKVRVDSESGRSVGGRLRRLCDWRCQAMVQRRSHPRHFMSFWSFIDSVLDWLSHWRFNLCFCLALVVAGNISHSALQWIVGGAILISGSILGLYWECSD